MWWRCVVSDLRDFEYPEKSQNQVLEYLTILWSPSPKQNKKKKNFGPKKKANI